MWHTVVCDGVGACHFGLRDCWWLVWIRGGVCLFVPGHVLDCDILQVGFVVWTVMIILYSFAQFEAKIRVHDNT